VRGGTLFSGIGSPELAAPWVDWRWCAEIDPFASAVLAARFGERPNLRDVQSIPSTVEPVDLIVFGSPCQSFSVAGKRAGLDDPRGNLALIGLRVVERVRPRWVVFENVPGLLSSDGWRDFGTFLGALGQCGYGFAYRVLDAQFAGVPQRRRRVFVVGYLGDWRPAAAVLFEPQSLSGHPPPRRETGQGVAPLLEVGARTNGDGERDGDGIGAAGDPMFTLQAGKQHGLAATTCTTSTRIDFETETLTLAIRGRGEFCDLEVRNDGIANALLTPNGGRAGMSVGTVAFGESHRGGCSLGSVAGSLTCGGGKPGEEYPAIADAVSVRRLTPRECERLQGFPDDFTLVTYRGKPAADGARYRVLGNAMAVPVIGWILGRIRSAEEASGAVA
jgi:DNA (cytosine-5)-methyltransferase 1